MNEHNIDHIDCRDPFLANGKYWLHALQSDMGVIGSIAIEQHGPDWVWLNDLFVMPQVRRKGVGQLLVNSAVRNAAIAMPGVIGCCAGIYRKNGDSQRLFERCGFEYVWEDRDGVRMYSRRRIIQREVTNQLLLDVCKAILRAPTVSSSGVGSITIEVQNFHMDAARDAVAAAEEIEAKKPC